MKERNEDIFSHLSDELGLMLRNIIVKQALSEEAQTEDIDFEIVEPLKIEAPKE